MFRKHLVLLYEVFFLTNKKQTERHCFKKRGGTFYLSVPSNDVRYLNIQDGEKPDIRPKKRSSGEKLTVLIIRGESLFDDD